MEVDVLKIKLIINKLFKYLEINNIDKVKLEDDYYWNIDDYNIKYDHQIEKTRLLDEIGLGSLHDEWKFIQSIPEQEDNELISSVTFSEACEILKYVGYMSEKLIK